VPSVTTVQRGGNCHIRFVTLARRRARLLYYSLFFLFLNQQPADFRSMVTRVWSVAWETTTEDWFTLERLQ